MKISRIKFIFSLTILLLGLSFIPQKASAQVIYIQPYVEISSTCDALAYMNLYPSSLHALMNGDSSTYALYDSNGDFAGGNTIYVGSLGLKNTLTYDTLTKQLNFNYTYPGIWHTNISSDTAKIYLGLCPSGYYLGNVTITKGTSSTTYSGTWTMPDFSSNTLYNKINRIYQNIPAIYIAEEFRYTGGGGVSYLVWQFDANPIITQNLSYSPPITIVNGKAFSITLPNANGKFVGINSTYGTLTGTVSGSSTILSGTLTGVPSSYTSLNIGSNTIQIRGVAPPSTSIASVSFY